MRLYEKYRPTTLDEIVGHDKIKKRLSMMVERGTIQGNAFLVSGPSGVGKSTLAYCVANMLADAYHITEFDAVHCTPARVAGIEQDWIYQAMPPRPGKVWIVNEVHRMKGASVTAWLTALERQPEYVTLFFTTTNDGLELFEETMDAGPFASRTVHLKLSSQGLAEPFANLAERIAIAEGLDGKPQVQYKKLVQAHKNNMRAVLQAIDSGEMME